MASTARAKQCAVLLREIIQDGTRPMNWAKDAINVVPTNSSHQGWETDVRCATYQKSTEVFLFR